MEVFQADGTFLEFSLSLLRSFLWGFRFPSLTFVVVFCSGFHLALLSTQTWSVFGLGPMGEYLSHAQTCRCGQARVDPRV